MEIGVFIPINNNGWIFSATSPKCTPSFGLNTAAVHTVARMPDEAAAVPGVKGIMQTFDDVLLGPDASGRDVRPLVQCRKDRLPAAGRLAGRRRVLEGRGMDALTLIGFAAALALSTASPGPTITTLVARVLARGRAGAAQFCLGLVLGDLVWLAAAVFGLSLVAEAAQPVLAVLKWAGVAFLLWLAWKAWSAPAALPADMPAPRGDGARLALAGMALTLGNPKTMLFYTAVTPAVLDLGRVDLAGFAALGAVLVAVYAAVLAGYVVTALKARHLLRSARAVRRVNQAAGVAMAGAAAAVATR